MVNDIKNKNIFGLCILAAAIFFGALLVYSQLLAVKREKIEIASAQVESVPSPVSLTRESHTEGVVKITPIPREPESQDILQDYEREQMKPGLLQIFRMGEVLPQKKVEGVEYVQAVKFRRQVGTGRVLADVSIVNDSSKSVRPKFQIMLFNAHARFLARDTMLFITEELLPGQKKVETLSLPHGPEGVVFYEIRQLD
jgi:hypothetical protein